VGNAEHFDTAVRTLVAPYGELEGCRKLQPFSHVFTHFKLHVAPFQVALKSHPSHRRARTGVVSGRKLADAPLPAPVKKLLLGVLRADDLLATA
jgi:A/G-specific adenine glycosylase